MKLINRDKRSDDVSKSNSKQERAAKREINKKKKAAAKAQKKAARKARRKNRGKRFIFSKKFPFVTLNRNRSASTYRFIKVEGLEKEEGNRALVTDAASAVVMGAAFSLILALSGNYMLIPFVIPGVAIFCLYTMLVKKLPAYIRQIIVAAFLIIVLFLIVIFRNYFKDGAALIMNDIFSVAEEYQAYIYKRYNVSGAGYNHPGLCMYMAVTVASSVAGLILAILPRAARRAVDVMLFVGAAGVVAYYGIIPSWICAGVLIAALIVALCNGRLIPTWPLILIAVILFGAFALIDPGESSTVRSANEYLRDTFAYRTAFLPDYEQFDSTQPYIGGDDGTEPKSMFANVPHVGKKKVLYICAGILLLAALIAVMVIHTRLAARRRKNKAGIDSEDPVIAVRSMFPYAVRWLRLNRGIKISNSPYSELIPQVRDYMAGSYADRFEKMHELWQIAAYSDHKITARESDIMRDFMEETISMTKDRLKLKDKLKARFRYAL